MIDDTSSDMDLKELAERGFGHQIGFGKKPAIIVIDVQRAFTDPSMPLGSNCKKQISQINILLDIAYTKAIPVIFTVVQYEEKENRDAGIWAAKIKGVSSLKRGTPGVDLDPILKTHESNAVVVKKYASGFFGTDLASRLTSRNVDTTILTGFTTSGCVRATAVDAIQYGFRPIVVEDAVGDRLAAAHEQSLFDMQLKYADVLKTENVLTYLQSL